MAVAIVSMVAPLRAASSDDRVARSVELAKEGLAAFNRGRFQASYDKFILARKLADSPVYSLYLARSKREQGQWIRAREHYREVVAFTVEGVAPRPTWKKAQREAAAELTKLEGRIPTVKLVAPPDAGVMLDGRPVGVEERAAAIALDPGEHRATLVADGARTEQTFIVAAGDPVLELVLEPPDEELPDERRDLWWPGGIVLGVAGASLIAGTVTGVFALQTDDDLEGRCGPDGGCPASEADRVDRLGTLETTSTVTLIAGGVLAAVGTGLLVWRPTVEGSDSTARFSVGPLGAQFRWSF
ncbi:MAG: hypothetical protein AAGA56_14870 [Myxococcota bacterium]